MGRAKIRTMEQLEVALKAHGFEMARGKRGGHANLYLNGRRVGAIATTPSDWRGVMNQVSSIRKTTGVDIAKEK